MDLKLYNTLSRKKEIFKPISDKKVGLYCCGPTVYWYAHLGNLRSFLFEDVLRRVLEYNGYSINHVMNYTDVGHLTSDSDSGEDKIEKGSRREGKTAWEIADFYIKAFEKDAKKLNIKKPTTTPRATDNIKEQIDLIEILEKKGFTYLTDDGVYFDTSKLKDYGKIARLNAEGIKPGSRVEMVQGKKNPTDFAIWKFSPPNVKRQMEWESPWAPPGAGEKTKGFPGWHIECSAMTKKYLGEEFDIHCGGIDHIPIHHANEIAQSEAAFGKIPARFWLHNEFLLIDGGRMGKSEENFLTLDKISKDYGPLAFRYLTLTAHYRSKLNFTQKSIEASRAALNKLYQLMRDLQNDSDEPKSNKENLNEKIKKYRKEFLEAINDDLDTPKAIGVLWKLTGDQEIDAKSKKELLLQFDKIFGLDLDKIKKIKIPSKIEKMIKQREESRQKENWEKADLLRQEIENEGWLIEDTPSGPKARPKS